RPAAAAANWVARIADAAEALAASALPPLKPNQPTHSIAAPTVVIAGYCGGEIRFGKPSRGPISHAATRADTPAVVCTTMPPAKSIVPNPASQPSLPHTQWATGTYTSAVQIAENRMTKPKRARSVIAPMISAGVMIA